MQKMLLLHMCVLCFTDTHYDFTIRRPNKIYTRTHTCAYVFLFSMVKHNTNFFISVYNQSKIFTVSQKMKRNFFFNNKKSNNLF